MPGRLPRLGSLRKYLTLTRLSVIIGMIASLVTIAAVLGLVGGNGDDSQPPNGDFHDEAVQPMAGAIYSGETDQGESMFFRVYVDGRSIRDLTVPLNGECSDGGPFTSTYRQGEATSFVITGGILSGSSSIRGVSGEIVDGIFRIDARFGDSGGLARGTVNEHAEIRGGGTCDTPDVGFTAIAEGG
jgi:hypothetical protein